MDEGVSGCVSRAWPLTRQLAFDESYAKRVLLSQACPFAPEIIV